MDFQTLNSLIQNVDLILSEKLNVVLENFFYKTSNENEQHKEIKLPGSLSNNQLNSILKLASKNDLNVNINWFYPITNVSIKKNNFYSTSDQFSMIESTSVQVDISSFLSIKELLYKFNKFKKHQSSRINEQQQFRNDNFNLFTYFDTKPIIPKFIQKQNLNSVINKSGFILKQDSLDKTESLLQQLFLPKQIQIISGLGKYDKIDLLIKINNNCCMNKQPCRIVYLQSLSIMTFWMALKIKEISNDKWNSIGYQITLESKTSLNNSIIFFEIATFIRVLNRDLNMSLITHLIIDSNCQSNMFFNLLFLFLKESIQCLSHLNIIILTQDTKQSKKIIDYFGSETFNINFVQDYCNSNSYTCSGLKFLFLDDIFPSNSFERKIDIESSQDTIHSNNSELIIFECWQEKVEIYKLVEFFELFPWQINYQCKRLNGITPLIVAVVKGDHNNVYQLLAIGADCQIRSWNGMEPIQWAIQYHREEIFQLLFTHQYTINPSFDLNLQHSYLFKYSLTSSMCPNNQLISFCNLKPPSYEVNYELILHLLSNMIKKIYSCYSNTKWTTESGVQSSLGSILIMLPSYINVSTLRKLIISNLAEFEYEFTIFCLYPNVPNNELDAGIGILSSSTNQVRVILSTFNVDSLLFRDIHFVINSGVKLEKVHSVFSSLNLFRMIENRADDAETKSILSNQTKPVIIYNLYRENDFLNNISFDNSIMNNLPTDSLYHCIFAAKYFNFKNGNKIMDIFDRMISRPRKEIISNALVYLKNINVLDEREELTELGKILIDISIEPHYAKMIIFSVILRCLDPILTIVCSLSSLNSFHKYSHDQRESDINLSTIHPSQKNFSDHLTYVYAFQKWQEICRSYNKSNANNVKMDQKEIKEIFSSFEMIYSLRTKILGQLRAIGFVKGKGSMNIRYLNTNSDNFSLVKAAICAGEPFDHFVQIDHSQKNRCFGPIPNEIIFIDPNSALNIHQKERKIKFPSNLVLFDQKINCGKISYIQNCTLINPLTVAIFADDSVSESTTVYQDNCIEFMNKSFHFVGEDIEKIFHIRQQWQHFVRKRLNNMQQLVSEEEENFMKDLIQLITSSDECCGFGSHPSIGRAPQVMSTYFCSTIKIKNKSSTMN